MTPYPQIRKPVATRSALPSGVIRKGAVMPPYFNLLLVISSYLSLWAKRFVHLHTWVKSQLSAQHFRNTVLDLHS